MGSRQPYYPVVSRALKFSVPSTCLLVSWPHQGLPTTSVSGSVIAQRMPSLGPESRSQWGTHLSQGKDAKQDQQGKSPRGTGCGLPRVLPGRGRGGVLATGKLAGDAAPRVFSGGWSWRCPWPGPNPNPRLPAGKQVLHPNHRIWANCSGRVSPCHWLQERWEGALPKPEFPDSSQGALAGSLGRHGHQPGAHSALWRPSSVSQPSLSWLDLQNPGLGRVPPVGQSAVARVLWLLLCDHVDDGGVGPSPSAAHTTSRASLHPAT